MNTTSSKWIDTYFVPLLCMGLLLNAFGLWMPVMMGDSMLYADISKNIVNRNEWLNLYAHDQAWLDKPHFPFWAAALSCKIFGVNAFAYKLPAFLFFLLGVYYTFKTACLLFNKAIARLCTLIYVIALHSVIANFDVRAEPYLSAQIIAATYYIICLHRTYSLRALVLTALFCALALMTKGLFTLISISAGLVLYWISKKSFCVFRQWRWYALVVLIFIFTLPELYALYMQFDMHPEKLVFGKYGVSGVRFFFWDSQFGRFFNTGPIKGAGDIFFFLHTTLWAFLPWTALLAFTLFVWKKTRTWGGG